MSRSLIFPRASSATTDTSAKRPSVDELIANRYVRPRIILGADATWSRSGFWDKSVGLTYEMFRAVATIGPVDISLIAYMGDKAWFASEYISDPKHLATSMGSIRCASGPTQINRILKHAANENAKQKTAALAFIGDACEEDPGSLYDLARELKMPAFMFQDIFEGPSDEVAGIFSKIADITRGVAVQFDSSSATKLVDLLKAVLVLAAGGQKALAAQNTEAARLLQQKLLMHRK